MKKWFLSGIDFLASWVGISLTALFIYIVTISTIHTVHNALWKVEYHRDLPTITYVVSGGGEQELLAETRGYPEAARSGGKYIFIPNEQGELVKTYIDIEIYVVPKGLSLGEKTLNET